MADLVGDEYADKLKDSYEHEVEGEGVAVVVEGVLDGVVIGVVADAGYADDDEGDQKLSPCKSLSQLGGLLLRDDDRAQPLKLFLSVKTSDIVEAFQALSVVVFDVVKFGWLDQDISGGQKNHKWDEA